MGGGRGSQPLGGRRLTSAEAVLNPDPRPHRRSSAVKTGIGHFAARRRLSNTCVPKAEVADSACEVSLPGVTSGDRDGGGGGEGTGEFHRPAAGPGDARPTRHRIAPSRRPEPRGIGMRGVEFSLPWPSGVGAGASRCHAGPGESALPSGTFQGRSLLPPLAPCNPSGAGDSGFMRSRGTQAAPSPVKASAMLLAGLRFAQKSSSAGSCSHIPQAERGSVSVQVRAIPGQSCCLCRGWAAHSVSEGGLTFSHGPEAPDVARAGLGLRRHMLVGHPGGAPLRASSSARARNPQAHRLECLRGGFSQ